MSETTGVIGIAAALPMEAAELVRRGGLKKSRKGSLKYYEGALRSRGVALFVSGVGDAAAYATAKAACSALPLRAYLSIGLSGALAPGMRPGTLVIGTGASRYGSEPGTQIRSDQSLLDAALSALSGNMGVAVGPLVAAGRVAVYKEDKRQIARLTGCIAVDMESFGAARGASEANVPFLAIRAISDTLEKDLPVDFNRFTKDGEMDYARLILHVITHPATIGPLIKLGRVSRGAAANVADAVERLCGAV